MSIKPQSKANALMGKLNTYNHDRSQLNDIIKASLKRDIDSLPDRSERYEMLGIFYGITDQREKSLDYFEKALRLERGQELELNYMLCCRDFGLMDKAYNVAITFNYEGMPLEYLLDLVAVYAYSADPAHLNAVVEQIDKSYPGYFESANDSFKYALKFFHSVQSAVEKVGVDFDSFGPLLRRCMEELGSRDCYDLANLDVSTASDGANTWVQISFVSEGECSLNLMNETLEDVLIDFSDSIDFSKVTAIAV